ncbi:hypothetical protein CDAR_267451 [Caerostris darwini]|uniref:Uncharacterized protein n=1 Tax=Caerostris darwini TaxID=1538125 RepID=A0AAV4TFS8_9ARAC|nr:hypothetical protein CDAR_267451 [Caerostris darwini]
MQSTDTELGACCSSLTLFVFLQRNFAQEVRGLIRADPSLLLPNQTHGQRNFAQEVRRLIRADPSFLPPNQTHGQVSTL